MVIVREFFCASSREEALRLTEPGIRKKYRVYAQHGLQGTDPELTRKVTGSLEELIDDTFILGSPAECVEQIARYGELGFTDICIRLFYPEMEQGDVLKHIELVGKEVIPAVHRL